MKTQIITHVKTLLSDRLVTVLIAAFFLLTVAYCITTALALRPSDLQVAVHYSAFGETTFYRDKWFYFINFILLAVIMFFAHVAISIKLHLHGRRELAISFMGISIFLLVITWFITASILRVAFL